MWYSAHPRTNHSLAQKKMHLPWTLGSLNWRCSNFCLTLYSLFRRECFSIQEKWLSCDLGRDSKQCWLNSHSWSSLWNFGSELLEEIIRFSIFEGNHPEKEAKIPCFWTYSLICGNVQNVRSNFFECGNEPS